MNEVAAAYDAAAWAAGPEKIYNRLAEALVAACPVPLAGARVLDVGAGTGAASRAAAGAGATVIGSDLSLSMLAHRRRSRPPAVVADARGLPFRDDTFDAVLAAFSYNQLPDPWRGFAEARRVTRPGGVVAATTFANAEEHPAKALVEAAAEGFGYVRPAWYDGFKQACAEPIGEPAAFARTAVEAGLVEVDVRWERVDVGVQTAEALVAWRLGMAHTAPFVAGLDATVRERLFAAAVAALGPRPEPLRPAVLLLSGRVAA